MATEVLQNIVLSGEERLKGLYSDGCRTFPVELGPGESLDLNAHFNYVPIGALRRYTSMERLFLELDVDGTADVTVNLPGQDIDPVMMRYVPGIPLELDFSVGDLLGVSVTGGDEGCVLRSGRFIVSADHVNDVRLALCVCTYHNEELVRKKMDSITGSDVWLSMKDSVSLVVVDNGNSLDNLPDCVKLIPSPNYGGSGGFARGMLEAISLGCTHVVLNDDDAMFDPEVLFRTLSFYHLIKKDTNICLGASFLYANRPTIVHESGATFEMFHVHGYCRGLDMIDSQSNLELSLEKNADFLGWWYCVIPTAILIKNGLTLPFFFKSDDIEYGLRMECPKINLCGISIWHPSFNSKYSVKSEYYAFRNLLISGLIHNNPSKDDIKKLLTHIEIDIVGYRYKEAAAKLRALEQVMEGPNMVFPTSLNPITIDDYSFDDIEILKNEILLIDSPKYAAHGLRHIMMNGIFLPSIGNRELSFGEMDTSAFYRVGKVLYTLESGKGVICERNFMTTIRLLLRLHRDGNHFLRRFDSISEEYIGSISRYSSEEFWKNVYSD